MLALPENYDDGFLWQGRLAPASDAGIQGLLASRRAEDPPLEEIERELTELPEVAIATPNVWNVMGLNQSDQLRPLQSADHYLVKLACALRPHRRQQSIEWARFSVTLSADASGAQPIAFD